ncbi:MAG: hypothetical protein DRP87_07260 [Spirochaetes bacterium]|nr:MAG: hypothetical protein DRP87_07260 [Spirochaetota bacterium]
MRRFIILLTLLTTPLFAQDYRGLSLSTDYPSIITSKTDIITLSLTVKNYKLPPQRVDLSILRAPTAWETVFVGNGNLISSVFVAPDESADAELWIDPPDNTPEGSYNFIIRATGRNNTFDLPITINIGKSLPRRLKIEPEFPSLIGTPTTDFSYRLSINNESSQDSLVNLRAQAPEGFQVTFKKAYRNQEITTVPIKAGKTEKVDMEVKPPANITAGKYEIAVLASTEGTSAETLLTMEITGQPKLKLTGPEGRLSGSATAGREKAFKLTIENTGSAPASDIEFSSWEPSNWKVEFNPKSIELLPAGEKKEVTALVTPSQKAIAGDYSVTFRANARDASNSVDFRITVRTSTLWGIVAVIIIAAALLVVVLAVMRYGRR